MVHFLLLSIIYLYEPIYIKDYYYYVSTKDVDSVLDLFDFFEIEYNVNDLELIFIY